LPSASIVAEVLRDYGDATRGALCEYLAPRDPQRHLYGLVADYPTRGGRMLRSSLCIAAARAFGAAVNDAVRSAAALELLHNAFLVHDDVEDESEFRRGRPTLNVLCGVPIAVNVGDALALLALRALMDNRLRLGARVTLAVLTEAQHMARESIEGQAIELGWRRDNTLQLTESDYLHMVLKKTCWYTTISPARIGSLVAGGLEHDLERFVRFGFFLGAAFQIQDDVLNLAACDERYGKEADGDIREGKRTLMLIRLLQLATAPERERVSEFLTLPRAARTAADVAWIRGRMDAYDCLDYARKVAHGLAGAARHECEVLLAGVPPSRDKSFLEELPEWVLART
jgi:geranylgeranyl diphosphate synthase type II